MKKRKVSNSTPFALGIVTRKGGDLRKQGSVSEASIARPGEPGDALSHINQEIFPF